MLPYINVPFEYLGNAIGSSTDELKLITSFLISYPLAGLLKRIPDQKPWQKNLFIISVALFYLVGLFDLWSGLRTLFISSAGTYLLSAYLDSPYMPWVNFVFIMGHMSVNQLHRQFQNAPSNVDITGAQMVLVMKLTAFAWNVQDGKLPESELSEFQKERAVRKLPDILDYAGYVLFFPSLMAGPAFDFQEYHKYISSTMFEIPAGMDPSKAPPTRKKRKIPRSGTPAMFKMAQGLGWILLFLQFSGMYYPDFLLGPDYMKYNFFRRVWILHMLGVTTRMKYYGVWTLTEGACILSGIGYKGVDVKTGRADWNRLQNVRPWDIETAQNAHAYLGNWNINTSHWLRNYMYLRVTPKGKKPGSRATLATFVTSAFWHGFYPGYYLAFVLAAFLQMIAKNVRRLVRPFFFSPDGLKELPSKRYYDVLTYLVTQLAFSFTVSPFILLTMHASLTVWIRVYLYTIVGVACSFGFLNSPGKVYLMKQLKKRNKGAELKRTQSAERPGALGLPDDPEKEIQAVIEEVQQEIERRKKEGGPQMGLEDMKAKLNEKVEELRKSK
ncbi:MBOAT family protein [Pseudovirgaria hyperparasitica]|uniref:MBOAT family protein n=1 Tax=Pseudovirgaria hyperparasitica TaxID=470096 RepID=A0A6A6VZ26_9PEZI|nr:MBOAT family protein [Pseudovirgaria hyperparasitica]KAF2755902.1 MBOAT family protein [Pseudovirgaria hyperparasitica]